MTAVIISYFVRAETSENVVCTARREKLLVLSFFSTASWLIAWRSVRTRGHRRHYGSWTVSRTSTSG